MAVPVLVAVAWPYASGSRHLGHLAGAYLPADIYARYQRLAGNDVLMVSGSDVHGTPITVRADAEGVTPAEIVDLYHSEFCRQWELLGISWDLYTTTGTSNHASATQDMFMAHLSKGFIDKRVSEQFYDPVGERFLPDRYIEGTCPYCGFEAARGDQCENCGSTLDAVELIEPRSRLTGAVPELRATEHFYFRYSDFTEQVDSWLKSRQGWRAHVLNSSFGWTKEGLQDRAITRDLDWGVELPVDDLGEGKRIYVWYDAVIGYLSASQEWAARSGDPEAWKRWWHNDDAYHAYFIGKDNIPFHTMLWPAQLMGYGALHLPDDVPANQYVTFSGAKMAASRGVGLTISEGLSIFEPDALRYALAAALPEQADTEISVAEIARRINDELVATWGNLVNRVLSLAGSALGGAVPSPGERRSGDVELLSGVDDALQQEASCIQRVELRAGLRSAMESAAAVNAYLNSNEPWKLVSTDPDRAGAVLGTALEAIAGVRTGLAPYLPFSTTALDPLFGAVERWERPSLVPGKAIPKPSPLFAKVDVAALDLVAGDPR
ncbi:MAG: methionine--tRNA ligase [Acidimicrobiaceae bacterium]|nr:methionine--tRNA ligase [Acidimicrobiaceae bacterium]MCY4176565.1 methionine--tRNA ligase [Acidimicrobiaceae bacterium]MCY4279305.1 methionine--tRNA ligase [Acidimicrobiaceae bacterium]MCY4294697.1 methionine--tRNA ligase [Acidimicrobiaceae bacterium]